MEVYVEIAEVEDDFGNEIWNVVAEDDGYCLRHPQGFPTRAAAEKAAANVTSEDIADWEDFSVM